MYMGNSVQTEEERKKRERKNMYSENADLEPSWRNARAGIRRLLVFPGSGEWFVQSCFLSMGFLLRSQHLKAQACRGKTRSKIDCLRITSIPV